MSVICCDVYFVVQYIYPSNPAYNCVFNPIYENIHEKQPHKVQPLSIQI